MTAMAVRRLLAGSLLFGLIAAAVILTGALVEAQGQTGCTMSGYVVDPEGRGVPNALVVLKVSGRPGDTRTVSNSQGFYQLSLPNQLQDPNLYVQETGYMYARLASGDVLVVGAINFKRCRVRRDIFSSNPPLAGYTPGPLIPPSPIVPAYPGPDAPAPELENAIAFFDLNALPQGGATPAQAITLPICVASVDDRRPQVTKVTFIAEYDPEKVTVNRITPLTAGQFSGPVVRSSIEQVNEGGRLRGRIWYEVEAPTPVELTPLPACIRIATVDMQLADAATLPAGSSLGLSTVKSRTANTNTSMTIGGVAKTIARTTTYLDILTPTEIQETLKRTHLPLIIKRERIRQDGR